MTVSDLKAAPPISRFGTMGASAGVGSRSSRSTRAGARMARETAAHRNWLGLAGRLPGPPAPAVAPPDIADASGAKVIATHVYVALQHKRVLPRLAVVDAKAGLAESPRIGRLPAVRQHLGAVVRVFPIHPVG